MLDTWRIIVTASRLLPRRTVEYKRMYNVYVVRSSFLCVLKLLTAVNFKNERKKKKKNVLNIRGIVWSWKKILNRVC